jgi:hypothetical protein
MRNAMVAAGLIAAGITANMGVLGLQNSPHPGHDELAKAPSPTSGHSSKFPKDSPLELLYDYYFPVAPPETRKKTITGKVEILSDSGAKLFEARVAAPLEADEQEQGGTCPSSLGDLDKTVETVLIATIPDPAKTHLALTFDRQLEAIMLAAQDSGYLFDRYQLPWRAEAEPESTDPDVQKKIESEKRNREKLPGLLLFRNHLNNAVLAIFLVGETPTAGLDRNQFASASCYAKLLQVNHQRKETPLLSVLGPTFSGSFESLSRALDAALAESGEKADNVEVRTGTATVSSAWAIFQAKYPHFASTVHGDFHTLKRLRDALPKADRVAMLSEDSTAFGQGDKDPAASGQGSKTDFDVFYYPREISRLRNAYQHDPTLAASQKSAELAGARRQLLLPLGDSQIGRDSVPQFSSDHTAITQETELLQIAESLKRGKFNAVIVSGTNVLDVLFLARFIREYCSDLRIIVLESDLLFVHGTDSLDYTGILVASTYPQFTPQDLWIDDSHLPLHPFASDTAEGVYNAGLAFLREKLLPLRDYSLPEYGYRDQPPVWISVVGGGSFWPVAALNELDSPLLEKNGTRSSQASSGFHLALLPRLWISVFLGCTALILFYAVTCMDLILHQKPLKPLKRWRSDLHPAPEDTNISPGRWQYHMATTLLLLITYCCLTLPAVYLAWYLGSWAWGSVAGLVVLTVIALIATAACTLSKYVHSRRARITIAAATLASAAIALVAPAIQPPDFRLFFFIRSVNLLSGVAPGLPILLIMLALIWYAWRNMQRFIFIQERDPYRPERMPLASCTSEKIQKSLDRSFLTDDRWGYLLIGIILISILAAVPRFGSLEPWLYDTSFLVLVSLSASCLLVTAFGYLQVWNDLRRFLEALNLHPIRKAFLVLPSVSTWSPLWQPNARKRSYAIPSRSVESLQLLCRCSPNYYDGIASAVTEIKEQVDSIIQTAERGERETVAELSEANEQATEIAKNLEDKLQSGPWSYGASETLDKLASAAVRIGLDEGEAHNPDTLAAEAVALRYIAFIRYVMLQLQNQLSFLTVGFILTAIALNCYPFQGRSYFRWWLTVVFIALSVVVIKVFAEMSRDATLSRLTDTPIGQVGSEFYFKVIAAGALPLLTVLASHFPGLGRFLFSWVQPAFSALH